MKAFALLLASWMSLHAAKPAGPSSFHLVGIAFSDNGPAFYYRVLEAKPDGPDTLLRYTRIGPLDVYCQRQVIHSAERRVSGKSPADLIAPANPCAVKARDVDSAAKSYLRGTPGFESFSFGVTAQCGPSTVSFEIPRHDIDLKRMRSKQPDVARMWGLWDAVGQRFGESDPFHENPTEKEDIEMQRMGESRIEELRSGTYDRALALAAKGSVGEWKKPSFHDLLSVYRGPIGEAEAKAAYVPRIVDAEKYQFLHFVPPTFPPLALMARISGQVTIELTVQPDTGRVTDVRGVSGHPLLFGAAAHVANQWVFAPDSARAGTIAVSMSFQLDCR